MKSTHFFSSVFDLNNPVFFDKNLLFENHTNLRRHLQDKRITALEATGKIREKIKYKY